MNIEFNCLELYVLFDDMFYLYLRSGLDFAKEKARWMMGEYNFTKAKICMKDNDTVLITIERE